MKRNSLCSLLTILFLLFSLSPASLAGASDPQASVYAVPNDGNWSGHIDRGTAVSFKTASSGTQWSNFEISYSFTATSCGNPSVDFTTGVNGPGTISGGYFSWSGSTDTYTGTFTSPTTATGTYAFTNKPFTVYPGGIPCTFYLTASGTWSATVAVPLPGAFSKLTPANAAPGQPTIVTLGWEASTNATSYEYCYGTSNPCSNWADNGLALTKTLTGLAPETTYYWQVRAKNATGTTLANSGTVWSFTLAPGSFVYLPLVIRSVQPPGSFVKLTPANAITNQSTSPILTWGVSPYATGYEYCIDTTNNNTCDATWVSNGTNTTASLTGLGISTKYYWQVRASNTVGSLEADGGTWWSFTTTSTQPPAAFNKTSPANAATSVATAPTLSWGTSNRATSYEYCIDTSNDNTCNGTGVWISNANLTSIGLVGLTNSTTYYWQVRAVNLAGNTEANGGTWWAFTTAGPSGPTPGFWKSTTGDEFYVSTDRANVLNFAISLYISACGASVKITRTTPVPIVSNQFSFTGSFYASGTFDTQTSAHGTDGLTSFPIYGCGNVTGGPWSWTGTWQDSSQPVIVNVGEVPYSVTVLPFPTPGHHEVDAP